MNLSEKTNEILKNWIMKGETKLETDKFRLTVPPEQLGYSFQVRIDLFAFHNKRNSIPFIISGNYYNGPSNLIFDHVSAKRKKVKFNRIDLSFSAKVIDHLIEKHFKF